jgi:uncharacterized membrane protein YdbT with pleckstrin-like domain
MWNSQAMDLHQGETVLFEGRPSWRSILGFYIVGVLMAAAVGAVVALIDSTGTGVAVFVVGVVFVVGAGWLRRIATRYAITSERLWIQRGLIARRTQETRLTRVQNVNTDQSMLQRLLQIGTVDFDTAGTDAPDANFAFRGVAEPSRVARMVDEAIRQSQPAQS